MCCSFPGGWSPSSRRPARLSGAGRWARHQLYRAVGRAAYRRAGGREAGAAGQLCRRFRRRRHAARAVRRGAARDPLPLVRRRRREGHRDRRGPLRARPDRRRPRPRPGACAGRIAVILRALVQYSFCDLCEARVSDADLAAGLGMRRGADGICTACINAGKGDAWLTSTSARLTAPRPAAAPSPAADPTPPAAPPIPTHQDTAVPNPPSTRRTAANGPQAKPGTGKSGKLVKRKAPPPSPRRRNIGSWPRPRPSADRSWRKRRGR